MIGDRYQFLKPWTDPGSGKTFKPGNVVRMAPGFAVTLVDSGHLRRVADFTLCRHNPLETGGCVDLNEEQKAALEVRDEAHEEEQKEPTGQKNKKK